jgi:zinc finger CCCH domain-containing protein 11
MALIFAIPMEDCYYFLYSSCKLGESCMYRHCEQCRNNLITCKNWKASKRCRGDCPFRHSEYHLTRNRKDEMCYWETRPEGCTKARCEYKHLDPAKDEWKEVKVRSLNEIYDLKNSIRAEERGLAARTEEDAGTGEEGMEEAVEEESLISEESESGVFSLKSGMGTLTLREHMEDDVVSTYEDMREIGEKVEAGNSAEDAKTSGSEKTRKSKRHKPALSRRKGKRARAEVDLDELDKELEELDELLK